MILDIKDEPVYEEIVEVLKTLNKPEREKLLLMAMGFQAGVQCASEVYGENRSA